MNILDINKLKNRDFDVCFHLAAQSRVQPSFDNPINSYESNVTGTLKIVEWAKINNVKVIYAGSSSRHQDPSQSPYAMTKFLGEEICKMFKKSFNTNIEIARFYNVYGPNEAVDLKFGNVIGIWRKKIENGEKLTIIGDGEQRRDFIHVEDLVDGLYKIALSKDSNSDAWELGTGVNYSINQLYNFFKAKFSIDFERLSDQPGNYRETMRVNDDSLKRLKWEPKDRLKKYIFDLEINN
jgi:UDP-glucose 4-epimerase